MMFLALSFFEAAAIALAFTSIGAVLTGFILALCLAAKRGDQHMAKHVRNDDTLDVERH